MTAKENSNREYFKVSGDELISKVKEIIREGNATRILIRNEKEETIVEFPLVVGAAGLVLAPLFAAIGAVAALATHCTIVVERKASTV
jgi:hypothetical protein